MTIERESPPLRKRAVAEGACAAVALFRWLVPSRPAVAAEVVARRLERVP
jgi:hypothetical protein